MSAKIRVGVAIWQEGATEAPRVPHNEGMDPNTGDRNTPVCRNVGATDVPVTPTREMAEGAKGDMG